MERKVRLVFLLLFLAVASPAFAQLSDLARVEYTWFPQRGSDNSFRRFRTFIHVPIKLNDKGAYLVPGLEYRNVNFLYRDSEFFRTTDLNRFQSFTGSLGYTFKLNEQWRFAAQTGVKIASNFSKDHIVADDFVYTGSVFFIWIHQDKRYLQPVRLILGLNYSTTTGLPFPLPIINYFKRFHPRWSYSLGTPKSNLKFYVSDKNSVQAFAMLDGFFANIQNNFYLNPSRPRTSELAENISMTVLLGGFGYEHHFTKNLSSYLYSGFTLLNDIKLRDENLDKIYTINDVNTFYIRGGLKFSIL